MKQSIVLDKSYLDGAPTLSVHALCDRYEVLVSDELFFELMTTRAESQRRCFSKLPDRPNPVALIPNVGSLLSFELEEHVPCSPVIQHKLPDNFQFNKKLRDGSFVFEGQVLEDLNAWKARVACDTRDFIERWSVVHQFFPELNGIEWKHFPTAINTARRKTALDYDFVREIYAAIREDNAPAGAPTPDKLTPDWALFRWLQCQVLSGLRLFGRYQGKVPEPQGKGFLEKAEHSMLDAYHLIHGSLVGGMATFDEEVREDLLLVILDSIVLSPNLMSKQSGN